MTLKAYTKYHQNLLLNIHQTFQVPKMEVLTYISSMDTAYVRENRPKNSLIRLSTSILGT